MPFGIHPIWAARTGRIKMPAPCVRGYPPTSAYHCLCRPRLTAARGYGTCLPRVAFCKSRHLSLLSVPFRTRFRSIRGRDAAGVAGAAPTRQLPTQSGFAYDLRPSAISLAVKDWQHSAASAPGYVSHFVHLSIRVGMCNRRARKDRVAHPPGLWCVLCLYRCRRWAGTATQNDSQNVTESVTFRP